MGLTAWVDFRFEMVTLRCINCGVPYGIPDYVQAERRKNHESFYCLNGHAAHYPQKNETEELRAKLERANRAKELAESTARMEVEQRRKVEKKLDRVNRGVCPVCKRSIKQLARHMQSKHGVQCNQPPKGSKVRV